MDIVEKLRRINGLVYIVDDNPDYDYELAHQAADEIERLREALREAWPYVPEHHGPVQHKIKTALQQKDSK